MHVCAGAGGRLVSEEVMPPAVQSVAFSVQIFHRRTGSLLMLRVRSA